MSEPRKPMGSNPDEDFVVGYMCLVDYECELGCASGGNHVYPSIGDIREHLKCVASCGIVEVEVRARRIVQEPTEDEQGWPVKALENRGQDLADATPKSNPRGQ